MERITIILSGLIRPKLLVWFWLLTLWGHIVPYTTATTTVVTDEGHVIRTPEYRFFELDKVGYPWRPKYAYQHISGLPPLRIHYIDEGPKDAKETLLLLHGTPAWSFLYRTMIPLFLKAGYRVVAIDNIGFGRSDKLTDPDMYSHALHVQTVVGVVRGLDLKEITLVAQDLGGPTGLGAMSRDPWRYKRIALLNTWLPQGDMLSSVSSIVQHTPYLSWRTVSTVLGQHVPVTSIFTFASDASPSAVRHGYEAPYPSSTYKAGPAKWPLIIPLSTDDPVAKENQRVAGILRYWDGPVLLAYSDRELFTIPGKKFLQELFPFACTTTVKDAGHFLQEDQGPAVADVVIHFISKGCH